ncbi:MAG: class I SAM-dependent methyltransferase [Proteobacteria bacterium]|nr:class I SAM-dependent methyltransferase [SAR86 cluster bacterium]MDA0344335.1 class I SAM-dependent methyltransferase [Pseudomonadota bacterium]MDA0899649.1 class I SAM-dependent methyltransferase [Pseudomonadota bacterium]
MLSEQANNKLNRLALEIIRESKKYNLTGYTDKNKFLKEQIDDCIQAYEVCKNLLGTRVVDVGSGAGIPGLVWAIVSDRAVLNIDSNRKKVKFQNEFITKYQIFNARTEHNRIENTQLSKGESLVCKAFSSIKKTIKLIENKNPKNILFLKKNDEKTKLEILEAKPLLYHYKIHPYKSNLGEMCVVEAYDSKNSNH